MTSFFPDLNVWVALSVAGHVHSREAWNWLHVLPHESRLIFSRYTHLGMLRLLTNPAAMGDQTLTLRKAWDVYDRWLSDPRVEFYPEPRGIDPELRTATAPFSGKAASKRVGDCYLLAYARLSRASLVTFDRALYELAGRQHYSAIIPG